MTSQSSNIVQTLVQTVKQVTLLISLQVVKQGTPGGRDKTSLKAQNVLKAMSISLNQCFLNLVQLSTVLTQKMKISFKSR